LGTGRVDAELEAFCFSDRVQEMKMDNEKKQILPFDVSRCWGRWPIGEPCEKRQQCKRYLGRLDKREFGSIPTADHLCIKTMSFFIDAKL